MYSTRICKMYNRNLIRVKTDKKDAGADFFGHAPASFAVHIEEAPVVRWSDLVNFFTDIQHFSDRAV